MFLEERHNMSQLGVLSNKTQIASYLIRHYVSVLNPNVKIRYRPICTDKFGVYTFKGYVSSKLGLSSFVIELSI